MEISPTTASLNVQVSNHIPYDIAFSILSKLPIKSLKRFECVCKLWSLLFDNPTFMKMYRDNFLTKDHFCYDGTSLLLHETTFHGLFPKNALYSLPGENFENRVKLNWPKPFPEYEDCYGFEIMGLASINGTLCLRTFNCDDDKMKLILWNPTTNEFKIIPCSPIACEPWSNVMFIHHLVGYDRVNGDYKVVQFNFSNPNVLEQSANFFWEIYSLTSNSWRNIDIDIPPPACGDNAHVYIDGVSHWLNYTRTHTYLVSFDFSNESFIETPTPSYEDANFDVYLVILNGSIAFILKYRATSTFHIFILGQVGIKESWTKLFIVGPLPYLKYPIGVGKKGRILFRGKDDKVVWFDLSTGLIDEISVTILICKILFHKENILPIELLDEPLVEKNH